MWRRQLLIAGLLIGWLTTALTAPVAAHVTVTPPEAVAGQDVDLAFTVLNERPDAATVKLEVVFPASSPMALVRLPPATGWTTAADPLKLTTPLRTDTGEVATAVSKVIWANGRLTGDQSATFHVTVGPVPTNAANLGFVAIQTYDSGETVRWADREGQSPAPEHPAPVVRVVATPVVSTTTMVTDEPTAAPSRGSNDADQARLVAYLALAIAVVALAVGIVGLRRRS